VLAVIVVLVIVVGPAAYLVWRFKRGEESVPGGSDGSQWFRKDDEWGPKP
jgi:hypothetical protein